MTMIALVFKTLIIIIMMMMMMMMMTIVVMGITQEDDRNITMKIFKNSKPGKIV